MYHFHNLGAIGRPPWAHGAHIFVENFQDGDACEFRASLGQRIGLGPTHVVLREQDEQACLKAFKRAVCQLPPKGHVTVKPNGGRMILPCYTPYRIEVESANISSQETYVDGEDIQPDLNISSPL